MVESFVSKVEGRIKVFGWDDDVVAMMVLDNLAGRARTAVEGAGDSACTSWVAMKAVLWYQRGQIVRGRGLGVATRVSVASGVQMQPMRRSAVCNWQPRREHGGDGTSRARDGGGIACGGHVGHRGRGVSGGFARGGGPEGRAQLVEVPDGYPGDCDRCRA